MSDKHIVIIGHGLAARCVIFNLNQLGFNNITVISSNAYAPQCSTRTTAINCLRGTKPGKSPLGDLILKTFADFEKFNNKFAPEGIYKTLETHCTPLDTPKLEAWNRRYNEYGKKNHFQYFSKMLSDEYYFIDNEAYIFSPEIFYSWMKTQSEYDIIEGVVTSVFDKTVTLKTGENIQFDELVVCTSYMTKDFSKLVADEKLRHQLMHSKPVPGSYLKFNINLFNKDELDLTRTYCFRIDEIHLIVRHDSQDVLIGATSTNNSMDDTGDIKGMQDQMDRLKKYLAGVVTLPDLSQGELITGIRHKGQQRTPYWGKINDNIYAVWGLYKNAFTFAFTAGEEISKKIAD